ncbi:hypothetical protein HN51_036388, partial [Arachis hypogaea]
KFQNNNNTQSNNNDLDALGRPRPLDRFTPLCTVRASSSSRPSSSVARHLRHCTAVAHRLCSRRLSSLITACSAPFAAFASSSRSRIRLLLPVLLLRLVSFLLRRRNLFSVGLLCLFASVVWIGEPVNSFLQRRITGNQRNVLSKAPSLLDMYIRVKRSKTTYFIRCKPTDKILDIKLKLQELVDQPTNNQRLIIPATGEVLEDSRTLADQKVENDAVVALTLRKDDNEFEEVNIVRPNDFYQARDADGANW